VGGGLQSGKCLGLCGQGRRVGVGVKQKPGVGFTASARATAAPPLRARLCSRRPPARAGLPALDAKAPLPCTPAASLPLSACLLSSTGQPDGLGGVGGLRAGDATGDTSVACNCNCSIS
jgi:hypothetical protein